MNKNKGRDMEFPHSRQKQIIIDGAVGDLELITMCPEDTVRPITAVICHPHPLYLGSMNNKVVHTLAKAFVSMGVKAVRFNFRGVGQSLGVYDGGVGETDDVLSVVQWVRSVCHHDQIWLAGFSFGSYVAARAAGIVHPTQLVTIAPAVEHFNFDELKPIKCPWLVIQGEEDEVVPPELVYEWAAREKPLLVRMPGTGHFFHGKLIDLKEIIVRKLSDKE